MKKYIIGYLLLVFAVENVSAQQLHANSELATLVNQSFGYFPKVKEVENIIATAEQKVSLTQLKVPVLSGDASYTYVQPKVEVPLNGKEIQFAPVHNGNLNITAGYELFDFGRQKANVQRAKEDVKYAKDNVEYVKDQLAYQVSTIYYSIIYLHKAIAIQDSVLNYLNENKQIVESKLKNGDALKIDLLNIQASIDAAQNLKVDLQSSLQKQINLLEYTTGSTKATGENFDFNIDVINADEALKAAQQNNKEYELAKNKIHQAESDVAVARLGDKPTVNLFGNMGYKNGYMPEIASLTWNYNAGVGLHIPIYNGSRVKKQTLLLQNVVKQNELALESMNSTYYNNIKQSLNDVYMNMERIRNMAGQIGQAKEAQQLATSRFKNGVGTNLEITNASTNVQRAELTRLEHEYHLCLAKLELARLMGYKYW